MKGWDFQMHFTEICNFSIEYSLFGHKWNFLLALNKHIVRWQCIMPCRTRLRNTGAAHCSSTNFQVWQVLKISSISKHAKFCKPKTEVLWARSSTTMGAACISVFHICHNSPGRSNDGNVAIFHGHFLLRPKQPKLQRIQAKLLFSYYQKIIQYILHK